MSPPPTSIDGTDITGATIDGTAVQEITVDGQVVFSALSLPNSAINRFKMDEGSGATIADSIGSHPDGDLNGATGFVSDANGQGGFVVDNGGGASGDDITFSDFNHFTPGSAGAFAITADFDTSEGTLVNLFEPDTPLFVSLGFGSSQDEVGSFIRDGSSSKFSASGALTLNTKQRLLLNYDLSALTVEFFVDGVQQTIDGTNFAPAAGGTAVFDDGDRRGNTVHGSVDDFILYDSQLTAQEVKDDFNLQPYS
jgi:hypothetical protein